jgi:hypothetical protein
MLSARPPHAREAPVSVAARAQHLRGNPGAVVAHEKPKVVRCRRGPQLAGGSAPGLALLRDTNS